MYHACFIEKEMEVQKCQLPCSRSQSQQAPELGTEPFLSHFKAWYSLALSYTTSPGSLPTHIRVQFMVYTVNSLSIWWFSKLCPLWNFFILIPIPIFGPVEHVVWNCFQNQCGTRIQTPPHTHTHSLTHTVHRLGTGWTHKNDTCKRQMQSF